jgi:hypothetical protein
MINLKKISNITLINKDTISKVTPPKKKKKYKKNKNQLPHNKKS